MRVIDDSDLSQFLDELDRLRPSSLPVYRLVENRLADNSFAWPGLELVVDQFPDFGACIVRPKEGAEDYVPRRNRNTYNVVARNPGALGALLRKPGVVDWSTAIYFQALSADLLSILVEVCQEHGQIVGPVQNPDFHAGAYFYSTDQAACRFPVPEGFQLKALERSEMATVARTWSMGGGMEETTTFLSFLNDRAFPSIGMYTSSNELIGFGICNSEMALAAAYVKPEHRGRHFMEIIFVHLCHEMHRLGLDSSFSFVTDRNIPSKKSVMALGGQQAWEVVWVLYRPPGATAEDDSLIEWYNRVYPSACLS